MAPCFSIYSQSKKRYTIFLALFYQYHHVIIKPIRSVTILSREIYLKNLIKNNGFTIKEFARKIDMPYSTLLTMLNEEKIGNAAVDNVIKICKGLDITIQDLQSVQEIPSSGTDHLVLTEHEANIISNYRQKTDLQKAVDILLLGDYEQ